MSSGDRLGLYEIVSQLGQGGMGSVYKARRFYDGVNVALKVRSVDSPISDINALRWEAEIGSMIGPHPNIVATRGNVEEDNGHVFLAMDYVDGKSIYDLIEDEEKLDPASALRITRDIADALDHLHSKNIVHRDVKSGNIMLKGENALLLDFGLAYDMNRKLPLKKEGVIFGTLGHIPPEYLHGREPYPLGDIYSLGTTLLHMLIGHRFLSEDASSEFGPVWTRRDYSKIIPNLGLPYLLENLCIKSVELLSANRFQTAHQFESAIDRLLAKMCT